MLGDRVRMQAHAGDAGVFIRSMATRGHLGGLARATIDAATVLDAAGKDVVLIETVGVGQDEVEIVRAADVAVVVLVPGMGDDVQALTGIMEISGHLRRHRSGGRGPDGGGNQALRLQFDGWRRRKVLRTVATTGGTRRRCEIERFRAALCCWPRDQTAAPAAKSRQPDETSKQKYGQ
jgi:LAO/AO transport system kinase